MMDARTYRKCATDHFSPNHAQLSKAVKGHDPNYRIRPKKSHEFRYALFVLLILIAAFGSLFVIAEAVK